MRRASCANWKSGIRTPDVQVSVCGAPDEGLDLAQLKCWVQL